MVTQLDLVEKAQLYEGALTKQQWGFCWRTNPSQTHMNNNTKYKAHKEEEEVVEGAPVENSVGISTWAKVQIEPDFSPE